jgi:hypothetical protein
MSPEAQKLLTGLKRQRDGNRRQKLETVIEAYYHAFPERRERADQRDQMKRLLSALEEAGALVLPKGNDCWQTMPVPALPLWIQWPPEPASLAPKLDHRTFPWVPELRFVASLPVLRDPEVARKIHDFLKADGQSRPLVPIKERSWELFGDEKALNSIKKGPLFKPGRLTLDHLRCFEVAASLPCRPAPAGATGPWLIVENEATFDSFARWNKEAKRHRGVILGNGFAVHRAEAFLFDLLEGEGAEYFGDLDERGCQIPYDLSRKYTHKGNGEITPAKIYYEWLLEACRVPEVTGPTDAAKPWLAWFPENMQRRILHATQLPKPPPQEAIGWEWLIRHAG